MKPESAGSGEPLHLHLETLHHTPSPFDPAPNLTIEKRSRLEQEPESRDSQNVIDEIPEPLHMWIASCRASEVGSR